jgi:HAD superfamily hydrolase (TIGR01490 family)
MGAIHDRSATARLAAFDVDETILSIKGLFSFAEYFFRGRPDATGQVNGEPFASWIASLRASGATLSREQVNRRFYRAFAGYHESIVERCAFDWFDQLVASGEAILIEPVLIALQAFRAEQIPVVLLSGSARLFLTPLAKRLDATHVLSIELETDAGGCLTGEVLPPQTIGDGKWQALRALLEQLGIDARECVGYGDHVSDLPFLARLGQAVIVAGDEALEDIAIAHKWPILPRNRMVPPRSWLSGRVP